MSLRSKWCPWVTFMCCSTDAQLQHKCPSTPTPAAFFFFFSVYCNPIGSFEVFSLALRGPHCQHCICVDWLTLRHICWEGLLCFIAKVHLKFVEHAFVTSVVDVGYDSRVLHSQHVFLLSKHLLCPSQEGEKTHWAEEKSILVFCQATGNLEVSPIKRPSFTLRSRITLLTWSIEPNKTVTQSGMKYVHVHLVTFELSPISYGTETSNDG